MIYVHDITEMIKVIFRSIRAFKMDRTMDAATDAEESLKSKSIPRWEILATYIRSEEAITKKVLVYTPATNKISRPATLSYATALNTTKSTSKMIVESKRTRTHLL